MRHAGGVELWGWTTRSRVCLAALALSASTVLALSVPRGRLSEPIDPALVVDLNTAPPGVLSALPRVGPSLVKGITAERERAPFRSLDDFDARVRRVGPVTVETLRPFLRFGPVESLASKE